MMFVEIGAPSLTGRSANQDVEKVFGQAKFPLEITFENFMPRRVAFPEVPGLVLAHVAKLADTKITLLVRDFASLQRLASSVEAIAGLNSYAKAMTFTVEEPKPAEPKAKEEPKAEEKKEEVKEPTVSKTETVEEVKEEPKPTKTTALVIKPQPHKRIFLCRHLQDN